ncbi:TonB-dependent receptor [Massilia eurypsychrophila]|jgi:iron complex outermembrane receptor protein|uniref:TonB-dependent receptor n=1 Tax=Massilia eurypsychrophila TaxID=1485217 RepID=A0A2G8TL91_9BURK|nr:TonB-dependent receptor [Massilia eurypsychrophila]PIL46820.1 TonB-dependent receptor [Massilia eurypsychrophila]
MQKQFAPSKHMLALSIASLFASGGVFAQAAPPAEDTGATVVVTGTRVANRTALDTTAPVDIISAEQLKNAGNTEITQALSIALPSLNFPRPGLTDGTDTVRPATLRGLAPDQSLVLVNSKRRHSSALVNVNGTVGRGSASVDMNTIPTAIVRTIEVLRDGASAQYGSDAISGVVNIRLRTDRSGGEANVTYGARITEYDVVADAPPAGATWGAAPKSRSLTDGQAATVSMWKGLPWGESGFVTIAAEYKDQKHTERSGYDMRPAYLRINGAFDSREATFNRFDTWYGEPEMKQTTLFVNAANPLGNGVKLYGWASYQNRDAKSAANVRRAVQDQNLASIYPDGFIPFITPNVEDFSATGGVSWVMGEWDMDASLSYGQNKMRYHLENTLNRSLGAASPTEFFAGGFTYDQLVMNLSGVRTIAMDSLASPLNVAIGAEARREGYILKEGEVGSYVAGPALLANGTRAPAGAQGFPGFTPADASDSSRNAVGAYIDLEANLTSKLLTSVAIRAEHYSDFGNNVAGKLAARYDFTPAFALRGSVQNGFRAPSPQQQGFAATSTIFINGVATDLTTFKPTDAIAKALGAKPLDAEKSVNLSLGGVMRFGKASLTVDAYRIKIKDRIVLSENLIEGTLPGIVNFLAARGFRSAGGRFFINGVDTTTDGVDVVLNMPFNMDGGGRFDLTLAANANSTEVTKLPTADTLSAFNPAPVLFGRVNRLTFEKGTPRNKLSANLNWKLGQWGATARATRYGDTLSPGTSAAFDFTLSAKTLVDLEARYALTSKMNLAVGADNVFDVYPDAFPPALNSTGAAMFSNYSPFGRSGRFVYARASYSF